MKARTYVDMQNTMLLNAKEKRRFCFSVIIIWNSVSGMVSLLDSTVCACELKMQTFR